MVYLGPPLDGWNSLKNLHIKTAASKKKKAKPVQPDDKKWTLATRKTAAHGKTKSES